jgi:hypothetical protein
MPAGSLITGATVSRTVTPKLPLARFPDPSVAVQVTVVVPSGNRLPESGEHLGEMLPLTVSVAEAENDTVAPEGSVASSVLAPGTAITGRVVSLTVIVKPLLARLPDGSRAVQVTVVVPRGNVLPEARLQLGVRLPPTVSVADTPE